MTERIQDWAKPFKSAKGRNKTTGENNPVYCVSTQKAKLCAAVNICYEIFSD